MRFVLDIDGTICNNTNGKYEEAEPYQTMVDLINELYDDGHYIIFHTARGMGLSGGNPAKAINKWYTLTSNQLEIWGIKYHELHLGKIEADIYIDDKGFRIKDDGSGVKDLRLAVGL